MFQGKTLRVSMIGNQTAELTFDREGDSINKLDALTINELPQAIAGIAADGEIKGLLVTSAKNVFIVGADIAEFGAMFKLPVPELAATTALSNEVFTALEDLNVPSVVTINGFALGGGLEFVLANALRVMPSAAQVGPPEVSLGLFPGFGGTVRRRVSGQRLGGQRQAQQRRSGPGDRRGR